MGGQPVADIVDSNADVQTLLLSTVDRHRGRRELDQLVREAYLTLASD